MYRNEMTWQEWQPCMGLDGMGWGWRWRWGCDQIPHSMWTPSTVFPLRGNTAFLGLLTFRPLFIKWEEREREDSYVFNYILWSIIFSLFHPLSQTQICMFLCDGVLFIALTNAPTMRTQIWIFSRKSFLFSF